MRCPSPRRPLARARAGAGWKRAPGGKLGASCTPVARSLQQCSLPPGSSTSSRTESSPVRACVWSAEQRDTRDAVVVAALRVGAAGGGMQCRGAPAGICRRAAATQTAGWGPAAVLGEPAGPAERAPALEGRVGKVPRHVRRGDRGGYRQGQGLAPDRFGRTRVGIGRTGMHACARGSAQPIAAPAPAK